jgi:hypothetical protein
MPFVEPKQEWVPVSDWGRDQKRNNEIYLRELAMQKRAQKHQEPKAKRVRVYVPVSRERDTCKLCPAQLGYSNKSGVCAKCFSKYRAMKKGPRPICKLCPNAMARTNSLGICYQCATPAVRQAMRAA